MGRQTPAGMNGLSLAIKSPANGRTKRADRTMVNFTNESYENGQLSSRAE